MIEDPMAFGIQISIIGLVVVFSALSLISILIGTVLGRVDQWWEQLLQWRTRPAVEAETPAEIPAGELSPELLAAISAAIAVTIDKKVRIKAIRYRRTPAAASWSVQGRATIMASHLPKHY